jgi:hypothetical protein
MSVRELIKSERERLPENLLQEILDFIQFLEAGREKSLLVKTSQEMSGTSFERVWDNKEDAVYDDL